MKKKNKEQTTENHYKFITTTPWETGSGGHLLI